MSFSEPIERRYRPKKGSKTKPKSKSKPIVVPVAKASVAKPKTDRPFNPYRIAQTDRARGLIDEVRRFLSNLESHDRLQSHTRARVRSRKPVDLERFNRQVEGLISDVVVRHLTCSDGWIHVSRSKRDLGIKSNYKPAFLTEKIRDVMDDLCRPEMSFLRLEVGEPSENPFVPSKSKFMGKRTRVQAGWRLANWVSERSLDVSDFGIDESEEVIYLKGSKGPGFWDEAKLISYEDSDLTRAMREEVRRINLWLEAANLDMATDQWGVDLTQRRLRRIFNGGSWFSLGRFWGGFWIDMKSEARKDILIDDEEVAELDFGQMGVRLLYAKAGLPPFFDDAYSIPGLEGYRKGVKTLLSAMVGAGKPLVRLPKGVRPLLPKSLTIDGELRPLVVGDVVALIEEFHQPVKHLFYKGLANELMFRESEIMKRVVLTLIDLQVTALPIHDGLVVAKSKSVIAQEVMEEMFRDETGFDGMVACDSERP